MSATQSRPPRPHASLPMGEGEGRVRVRSN